MRLFQPNGLPVKEGGRRSAEVSYYGYSNGGLRIDRDDFGGLELLAHGVRRERTPTLVAERQVIEFLSIWRVFRIEREIFERFLQRNI